ncbi:MAG: M48 family metallopeptidase [Clostridia bacterium]|nr:M48 family metallopeptidase [Clostridia bacterium]
MLFKLICALALILTYVYSLAVRIMNWRSGERPVPECVSDVYDPETYARRKQYNAEKSRHSIFALTASFIIEMALLMSNAYAGFASLFPGNDHLKIFAVVLLSALASLPIIPFEYYDTMIIEAKYGFNKTSKKTFFSDQIKNFIISVILTWGIATILMLIHRALGDWLILVFAGAMVLIGLAISFLYPVFSKIFNKFKPLEEGELRSKLAEMLESHGYHVRDIKVMDASRRTTKSNAYFTGFEKMKTIVLYDTLVEAMEPDEICAVFAHEMGHGLHRDTLKNQLLSVLQMLIIGVLAWLTLRTPELFAAFGFDRINYGFAVLLIMTVEFALISPLFGLLANAVSRRAEYRADAQAVKEGYADELVSALKKLARQNFSDLSPHPALVKLEYSHPTLAQRIEAIDRLKKENSK